MVWHEVRRGKLLLISEVVKTKSHGENIVLLPCNDDVDDGKQKPAAFLTSAKEELTCDQSESSNYVLPQHLM